MYTFSPSPARTDTGVELDGMLLRGPGIAPDGIWLVGVAGEQIAVMLNRHAMLCGLDALPDPKALAEHDVRMSQLMLKTPGVIAEIDAAKVARKRRGKKMETTA